VARQAATRQQAQARACRLVPSFVTECCSERRSMMRRHLGLLPAAANGGDRTRKSWRRSASRTTAAWSHRGSCGSALVSTWVQLRAREMNRGPNGFVAMAKRRYTLAIDSWLHAPAVAATRDRSPLTRKSDDPDSRAPSQQYIFIYNVSRRSCRGQPLAGPEADCCCCALVERWLARVAQMMMVPPRGSNSY
jgi:hypothetical protein